MGWFEHNASRVSYDDDGGAGDPALVLPGFAGSVEELGFLREALATAGYRVIAADLPGSGRSGPQPRSYTPSYLADDARTFAALLEELATGPAHVVGFSDGGEVALLMAELAPDSVRSVAAWGAAGAVRDPEGHLLGAMRTVIDQPIPPLADFRAYLIDAYGEANARAMTQSFADAMGEVVAAGGDISAAKAGSISCPVLLIAGEHDMLATVDLVSELAGRIPAATFVVAKDAGHAVQITHPEWLAETILDWLGKQAAL